MSTELNADLRPQLASKARLRWDRFEQRYFLLYPERGLLLGVTAHAIVELCDGARSVHEIVDVLSARFTDAPRATIEFDVKELLEDLRERNLLVLPESA